MSLTYFPLIYMKTAQRFVSLSALGVMALALAPVAGAQGFGGDIDQETRSEIRAELETCKENNESDREAMKACADAVFENYGIERPERPHRPGKRIGHRFRSHIEEACGERENTDEWKECARNARGGVREERQEHRANLREQLSTCLELDDISELKACVKDIRDQIRDRLED